MCLARRGAQGALRRANTFRSANSEALDDGVLGGVGSEQPRVASGGTLSAGDVLFFYTKRIHRAPPPPAARSPRYPLRRLLQAGQDGWAACGAGPLI